MNPIPADRAVYLYSSSSNDVYLNLAREEYLFDTLPPDSRGFLLYLDAPSVVIGKHQNPWRECSVGALRKRNIPLARRISGGGTVYHDLGNLNFSFILPKRGFDRRENLELVVAALGRIGIDAEVSERHDLYAGGKKISGNAFCFRHDRALHHGTLLVSSRLEDLHGALAGMGGIDGFAVESKRAEVVNIGDLDPDVDIERIVESLTQAVVDEWGEPFRVDETALGNDVVEELRLRNASIEWVLDRTPRFTVALPANDRTDARNETVPPMSSLSLTVDKGRITQAEEIATAGISSGRTALLSRILIGLRFDSSEIADALASHTGLSDLATRIESRSF